MDTIVAISTPIGSGGISIVRMSGDKALDIAFSLFSAKNLQLENIKPRYMYLGDFVYDKLNEKCLMVFFKNPNSYTGEDLIEFQVHGGEYLTQKVLKACLNSGARLAENGEFTKRAFVNGKMSLDNVEGVIDVINATSDLEIKAGYNLMKGKMNQKISDLQKQLTDCIVELDVSLDYPEHDIEYITLEKTAKIISEVEKEINKLLETEKNGQLIKNGINVAIVGKPNAGKSSLLNSLLGEERAIVTSIAGTTRDTLKESIVYKGIKINFIDTAGIRNSTDIVEKIGIERAQESIKNADIVLFVVDNSITLDKEDKEILDLLKDKNYIVVLNKCDIGKSNKIEGVEISALKNENIDIIKEKIIQNVVDNNINNDGIILTNLRQTEALKEAKLFCIKCQDAIKTGFTDIVCMEVREIWNSLGKVTGETENKAIIDNIFAKFCLGK